MELLVFSLYWLGSLTFFHFRSKGNAVNLMKSGAKRRRTNQEIEDERVAKVEREAELNQKLAAMA